MRRIRELIREEELKCYGEINQNQSLWVQYMDRQDVLDTYRNMTPEQIHGLITQEVPTLERVRHAGIIMDRIIEGTQRISRAFGRERRDEFTVRVDQLREEIALERQRDNPNNITIQRASNELKQTMEKEAEKANEQWETEWAKCGERLTPTLASLEKNSKTQRFIPEIITTDPTTGTDRFITNQEDILNELKNFYEDLYKETPLENSNPIEDFFPENYVRKVIKQDTSQKCEQKVTEQEYL